MRRRRFIAAGLFSVAMAAVLAVIVYTEHVNASAYVTVWMLTHDVVAGATYSSADVQQVQVKAQPGDFAFETRGPSDISARYSHALTSHDILRSDDLLPQSAQAEVAITVQNPPPLNAGDLIDVYAGLASGQDALVGHDITVESVAGGALTVLIPASDEAAWVAVGASNVAMHVARAVPGARNSAPPLSADSALRLLCGPSCAEPTAPP